jgi:hypothetical protein
MRSPLGEVVQEFRNYAAAHGRATLAGDYEAANKNHDKLVELVPVIREYGTDGRLALALLADDADDAVSCWSATHLLKVDEAKAISVLSRLAAKTGPMAFNAEMVLKQWRKGDLMLP